MLAHRLFRMKRRAWRAEILPAISAVVIDSLYRLGNLLEQVIHHRGVRFFVGGHSYVWKQNPARQLTGWKRDGFCDALFDGHGFSSRL